MDYESFIAKKRVVDPDTGFMIEKANLNKNLFDFQRDIVAWSLRRGRAAIFADCGLGKSLMQLEWAHQVALHTGGKVLILAPLAVSHQTILEGVKFGIDVALATEPNSFSVHISNYEKLHKLDVSQYVGIVLDESSILKSFTGKTKCEIIECCKSMKYRLACTATPAPNDIMELGNHSDFLGVMRSSEMLAAFFINDPAAVGKYRVKGHAENEFWAWVSSWSVMIKSPADLGYESSQYQLPELITESIIVNESKPSEGMLFAMVAHTMQERRSARKNSLNERVEAASMIANSSSDQYLVWCDLNAESEELTKQIDGAVEVKGSHSDEIKTERMHGFISGKYRVLVTKPSIAGFGLNMQNCNKMIFTGLSDSFEQYYQAVRRCWRFGQKKSVCVYVITADTEGNVVSNIKRKQKQADELSSGIVKNMSDESMRNVRDDLGFAVKYQPKVKIKLPIFLANK